MLSGWTVVLDVGKTLGKLTLWDERGALVDRRTRANVPVQGDEYAALDEPGIRHWLETSLTQFALQGPVTSIVPVGHGAAAAILREGRLVRPPLDYEFPIPEAVRERYMAARGDFAETGSPPLPEGLNLGAQLFYQESLAPELFQSGTTIVTWPQYWAWLLCGVAATELTSLGCHTDLWCPAKNDWSGLVYTRGWHRFLAPLRQAGEVLGTLRPDMARRLGLSPHVEVYCGLHDSNAALLAARGFKGFSTEEMTVVSTGTWFVAMRVPGGTCEVDTGNLPEHRDCLMNVDPSGRAIPSARFMGGREYSTVLGSASALPSTVGDANDQYIDIRSLIDASMMLLPTFAFGAGPFPHNPGRWSDEDIPARLKPAAVSVYAALMTDTCLDLIGARERILIEGRFAEDRIYVEALAALRQRDTIYISNSHNGVPYGALRLLDADLGSLAVPEKVRPLPLNLEKYKAKWRNAAEKARCL